MKIVAIILTLNEAHHLRRCMESLQTVVSDFLVVDSFSTDQTRVIAECLGGRVLTHRFVNHADQFNWALSQLDDDADWVMRIDADEYITPALAHEINTKLPVLDENILGIYCNRRMVFQGKLIRFGGVYPIKVLRLWRNGHGRCENRWMDEHIIVDGRTVYFHGDVIDHNLGSLTWWIDKHNGYSSREAVELLNLKYGFFGRDGKTHSGLGTQAGVKRWIKENLYVRFPRGFRAFAYFFYRYIIFLGFLDGKVGASFHFLQGFWYRYLVDAKVDEVERYMRASGCDVTASINSILNIKVIPESVMVNNKDGL